MKISKVKKTIAMLMIVALIATICVIFAACDNAKVRTVHISTFEDLINAKKQYGNSSNPVNAILDNDIDCNFQEVDFSHELEYDSYEFGTYSYGVFGFYNSFDGNGHTIKNIIAPYSLFGTSREVKNLTIDNATISTNGYFGSIILTKGYYHSETKGHLFNVHQVVDKGSKISNVHVKNSKLSFTERDSDINGRVGIFAACAAEGADGEYEAYKRGDVEITNCTATNVTIEAVGTKTQAFGGDNYLNVGAISGTAGVKTENCVIDNCKISAESKDPYNYLQVAGLFGNKPKNANISGCAVKNTEITATASWYNDGTFGFKVTSDVYVGGLVGTCHAGNVSSSYSSENTINVVCTGAYRVGGLAGYNNAAISQCYAINNTMSMRGRMEKDNETNNRYAGGLVAETDSGATYMSSYAFGNSISDPDGANLQERESYQAGFIAIGENALIMNCAAAGTKFSPEPSQAKRDEFSTTVFSKDYLDTSINYIYPDEDIYDIRNVNKCTIVTKLSDFYDPAKMKEMLALTDSRWVFKENSLPVFNF